MGKRVIFYQDKCNIGSEIESFLNTKGKISIVIKYENDYDADLRCIQLTIDDFNEMVKIVNKEIKEYNGDI